MGDDMSKLSLIAFIVLLSGCSTHFSTLTPASSKDQILYLIQEDQALAIAYDSIVLTLPGRKIQEVEGSARGFTTYFRFLLDTYTQTVLVFRAKGTDADGAEVRGCYFEVSGSGTSFVQGRNKNVQLYAKVVELADATMKKVAVSGVERIPYTQAVWRKKDIDVVDQLRQLKQLRDEGVISEAEFEALKKELLSRLSGETKGPDT